MVSGKFIVIEGSDGSGKSTHFQLLKEYFEEQGKKVATYKFPQHGKPAAYFTKKYLNGEYGEANTLGAYTPSLFYALDRFDAAEAIRRDLAQGKIVLCDRYVASNMAHQGQKIDNLDERKKYYQWTHETEFSILGIPKPNLNIVLLMPVSLAESLMNNRQEVRAYTTKTHDIHEADKNHLERAVATYKELCEIFPNDFTAIHCADKTLRSIQDIQADIRRLID